MLVLTRKADEGIVIEGGIKITILKIRGNQVQLGIEAPKDVIVRRTELDWHVCPSDGQAMDSKDTSACCHRRHDGPCLLC